MVVQCRVAARIRSKISASPRTSSCAVGSSSSTTPAPSCTAQSARASATRCHCRRRDRCRLRSRAPAPCRGAPGSRAPAASSAAMTTSSGAPPARRCRAAAARSGRSPGTPRSDRERHDVEHRGRAASMPSTSIAPRCGSYNRHSSLASVVLPAPFCPTIASDEPAGIVRSKPIEDRRATGIGEGDVAEADLAPRQARSRLRVPEVSAPAGAIAGSSRSDGRDRRRGAVQRPVEPAERDQRRADGALRVDHQLAEVDAAARRRPPPAPRARRGWRRRRGAGSRASGRSRRRVASYCSWWSRVRRRRIARSSSRPGRTAAVPCSPADRRRAGRRSRRRAARSRTSSVLRSCQTALSRSSQCVASHAPASTSGAHHANPNRTAAAARPPIMPTRPPAMKSIEYDSGGPVMPRSKSRATVRSAASAGSSRWPMPGGRTHASVSRS